MSSFIEIRTSSLKPSPTNPRKSFPTARIQELAESIAVKGVLQPLLVRENPESPQEEMYEIVCGECRWRGAVAAKLEMVPCIVKELDDKAVLEIQFIENLQRSDLHPVEEADGYVALVETHGYTIEDLALKIGKSTSYVSQRMRLARLPKKVKAAFLKDEIVLATAILLARIPDATLCESALGDILDQDMSPSQARDLIQRDYMLILERATFDTNREDLGGKCACTVCPARTGFNKELFPDLQKQDLCTNPACWREKLNAWWQIEKAGAEKAGIKVLPEKEADKILDRWGVVQYTHKGKWTSLDDTCYSILVGNSHPTYAKLFKLKKVEVPYVLARSGELKVCKLVDTRLLPELLRQAGFKKAANGNREKSTAEKEQAQQQKIQGETDRRLTDAFLDAIGKALETITDKQQGELVTALALNAFGVLHLEAGKGLCRYLKIEPKKGQYGGTDWENPLKRHIQENPKCAQRILIQLLSINSYRYDLDDGAVLVARAMGIDYPAMKKRVAALVKEEFKARKDAKKPAVKPEKAKKK